MNSIARDLQENKAEFETTLTTVLDTGAGDRPLPANPSWRVRDVVAHLAAAEQGMYTVAQIVVAKGGYEFKPYDRDAMNQERVDERADTPLQEIVNEWLSTRNEMIAFAARLGEEELAYEATEPYWGRITTRFIFRRAVKHTDEHLAQVRAALDEDATG